MADIKNHSTLPTNLISYWDMQETSGTRYDLHGANNLTDNNTVLSGTGKIGNCADFEASNSEYLSVADNADLDVTGNFSFSFWIRPETLATSQAYSAGIITKSASGSGYAIVYNWGDNNKVSWIRHDATTSLSTTTQLAVATWYHIVFTYDGTNMRVYVNGTLEGSPTAYTIHTGNAVQVEMGRSNLYTTRLFDGMLEEVGIWSKALTAGEVTDLYNSGNGLPYYDPANVSGDTTLQTSMVSYWELNETSGTRVDAFANNDLTDNNTVLSGTGKVGNCADFEATNSEYLSITDASQTGLDFVTTDFSWAMWVKLETLPSSGDVPTIIGKFNLGTDGAYQLGIYNNAGTYYLRCTVFDSTTPTENLSQNIGTFTPVAGTWYHVVWTFDEANFTSYGYIDGVLIGSAVMTGYSGTLNNSAGALLFGQYYVGGGAGYQYDGLIDEAGAWSKRLSIGEIRALYGYGTPPEYGGTTNVTVSPAVLTATFTIPAYTATATQQPNIISATFSIPTYTVTDQRNVSTSVGLLTGTFTIPAYALQADFWEDKYVASSTTWADKF